MATHEERELDKICLDLHVVANFKGGNMRLTIMNGELHEQQYGLLFTIQRRLRGESRETIMTHILAQVTECCRLYETDAVCEASRVRIRDLFSRVPTGLGNVQTLYQDSRVTGHVNLVLSKLRLEPDVAADDPDDVDPDPSPDEDADAGVEPVVEE